MPARGKRTSKSTKKRLGVQRELTVTAAPRPASSLGLLTLQEAADELRLGKTTVIRLLALGQLKAIRPVPGGKCVRIFREDLQAFVDGLRKA